MQLWLWWHHFSAYKAHTWSISSLIPSMPNCGIHQYLVYILYILQHFPFKSIGGLHQCALSDRNVVISLLMSFIYRNDALDLVMRLSRLWFEWAAQQSKIYVWCRTNESYVPFYSMRYICHLKVDYTFFSINKRWPLPWTSNLQKVAFIKFFISISYPRKSGCITAKT